MRFRDRADAGRALAGLLVAYERQPDVFVLALPRGGVPVGFEVARALGAPLDAFTVRRLGAPGFPEYAMGAIATGGVRVLNNDVVQYLRVPAKVVDAVTAAEQRELERTEGVFRGARPSPDVHGRTVILVDDGLCTGASLRAAGVALRQQRPARVVAAVPTALRASRVEIRWEFDDIVSVMTPEPFHTVGHWYEDFTPPTDQEVRALLELAWTIRSAHESTAGWLLP